MTDKQKSAIKKMNAALRGLKSAKIHICGMDDDLLYATKESINKRDKSKDSVHNEVANTVQQRVGWVTGDCGYFKADCYLDSGGW